MSYRKLSVLLVLLFAGLSAPLRAAKLKDSFQSRLAATNAFSPEGARKVRVGVYQLPPLNFMDEAGLAQGLNIDLLREIAHQQGWLLEFVPGNRTQCLSRLQSEEIDLMLSVVRTAQREERMDFSHEPVAEVWGQIFVRPDGAVRRVDDLRGRTVGITRSEIIGANFVSMVAQSGVECTVREFDTHADLFEAVQRREVDAGVAPQIYGLRTADRFELVPGTIQFSPRSSHFAVKKGRNHRLLSEIDARMILWRQDKDSYYYDRVRHWLGPDSQASPFGLRLLWAVLGSLAVVVLIALVWIHFLRGVIRSRTRQLTERKVFSNAVIASLPGFFYVLDEQGHPVRWNENYQRASGFSEEELPAQSYLSGVLEEDHERVSAAFEQCLQSGRAEVELGYFDHVFNETRRILARGVRVEMRGKKYVVGIGIDMTDRYAAELNAEALAYFPQQNPNPVMRVALDGTILFANEAGKLAEPACGCTGAGRVGAETQGYLNRSSDENRPVFAERTYGDRIYKFCYTAIAGKPYANIYGMDITEQKQAESERLLLSEAIHSAAEAVVVTDAEGTIQYVNPAFTEISGYSEAEVLGHNPRLWKSGEHPDDYYETLWQTITAGRTWQGRFKNKRKDGTLYVEEGTISAVKDADGHITNYVAVKRDITRELAIEEQYRQSQKLESVGQLAGGVAHDLNNLLTPVLGYGEILLHELALPDDFRLPIEQIMKAGVRARDLIRQLLTFGRRNEMQMGALNLNEVIGGFDQLIRKSIPENIEVCYERDEDLAPVWADRGQMEQVIMNLAVNARDAMPDGGRLLIKTRMVKVSAAQLLSLGLAESGTYVAVSVFDNGTGMDSQTVARVFEPFFSTKEVGKGTGLGLATVFGIVSQHHGSIRVDSSPGKGTLFEVLLPACEPVCEPAYEPDSAVLAEACNAQEQGDIWLVEDEVVVKDMMAQVLQRKGYHVRAFESPAECLAVMYQNEQAPDLLITDVIMPGMNGKTLAAQIRKKWADCPVLFISGYAHEFISAQDLDGPRTAFLKKPFGTRDLFASVGRFVKAAHSPD